MDQVDAARRDEGSYPVRLRIEPAIEGRNRLTTAFRIVLAIPHLLIVGGPIGAILSWGWSTEAGVRYDWGAGGGVLGAVAVVVGLISWFAIVFTGRHPDGLWNLAAIYLRWRVRAVAYIALLRDEYPPFGDGPYAAELELKPPTEPRDRLAVAFRLILAIPHIFAVWVLGIAWGLATIIAWFAILFTGQYPEGLYRFAVAVLRWNIRVEAYVLLLRDEYPPFSLADAPARGVAGGMQGAMGAPHSGDTSVRSQVDVPPRRGLPGVR